MNADLAVLFSLALSAAVVSLFFLTLGLRGVVTKRPFVMSSRWACTLLLAVLPMAVTILFVFPAPAAGDEVWILFPWIGLVGLAISLVYVWFFSRGYVVIAATHASFKQGLLASLEKLGLPYQESTAAIKLPSLAAEIPMVARLGVFALHTRPHSPVVAVIARGMREFYRSSTVPIHLGYCIFSVVLGSLVLGFFGLIILMSFGR